MNAYTLYKQQLWVALGIARASAAAALCSPLRRGARRADRTGVSPDGALAGGRWRPASRVEPRSS